jgi:hypothetical protein
MKLKTIILLLFAGGFLLTACQKNTDIFVPNPGQTNGPDTSWHTTITAAMPVSVLKNSLLPQIYVDSFIISANIATVITPSGLQVNFSPNCCVNSIGQPITGRVQVEIVLVKKKGDMIRMNLPSTYNDSLLVAAGHIFIRLLKNGQPVQLAPTATINIRYIDLPTNPAMAFFVGDEISPQHFNWLANPNAANNIVIAGTQAYEIYTNRLRWISIAYAFNFNTAAKVNIAAGLPAYFTNANTIAFTVLKDLRSVVAMHGDLSTRKFISSKIPVGKIITVVVISKQGDDYYLGHETSVAQTSGTNSQLVQVMPIKKSIIEILSYLSSL